MNPGEPAVDTGNESSCRVRSQNRRRKIIKTARMGLYAKAVSVAVSLVMVPLAVNYLGVEFYGLWVAVSSFIAMLSFIDGGVGNAIVNTVSYATGTDSGKSLKEVVSSGLVSLLLIAGLGGLLFLASYRLIPWSWVFGLGENAASAHLETVVLIVGLSFFANIIFSGAGKVQRGLQEGNIEAFWAAKGQLLSVCFVVLVIWLNGGLAWFAFAFVMGPLVALLANNIYYFAVRRKELIPRAAFIRAGYVKEIFGVGGMFFVLQITAVIQVQADNVIIANMLGPSAVTPYAVCNQMFMVVPVLMGLLWMPTWPAYREALSCGDHEWIRRIFFKSIRLAFLAGLPVSFFLVVFGQDIVRLWVGDKVNPSDWMLLGFGIWQVFLLVGSVLAMLLNAVQWLKVQILVALCAGTLNVVLTIFLIHKIGVTGAIWGTVISYFCCSLVPYSFLVPKLFLRIAGETHIPEERHEN